MPCISSSRFLRVTAKRWPSGSRPVPLRKLRGVFYCEGVERVFLRGDRLAGFDEDDDRSVSVERLRFLVGNVMFFESEMVAIEIQRFREVCDEAE